MVYIIELKKSKKREKKRIYELYEHSKDEYEKFKLVDPIVFNLNVRRKYKGNVIIK